MQKSVNVQSDNFFSFFFNVNKSHCADYNQWENEQTWQSVMSILNLNVGELIGKTSFAPHNDWLRYFTSATTQWGMDYVNIDFCLVIYHSLIMTMLACCWLVIINKRKVKKIISNSLCVLVVGSGFVSNLNFFHLLLKPSSFYLVIC